MPRKSRGYVTRLPNAQARFPVCPRVPLHSLCACPHIVRSSIQTPETPRDKVPSSSYPQFRKPLEENIPQIHILPGLKVPQGWHDLLILPIINVEPVKRLAPSYLEPLSSSLEHVPFGSV